MSVERVSTPSFKGYYKVTIPNVKTAKTEQEKAAYSAVAVNTVLIGLNNSSVMPRVSKDRTSIYYKINDKADLVFETGFNNIIEECNKQFNINMAEKAYYEKVSEEEFNQAEIAR